MRLKSLLLAGVAGFAPLAMADWLETTWGCSIEGFRQYCGPRTAPYAHFHTDFGSYYIPKLSDDGCRSTSVPGMTEFCMDWAKSRAHFRFSHQNYRRCLRKKPAGDYFADDSCPVMECWHDYWDEVPCDW
jgi:hypothetical protein